MLSSVASEEFLELIKSALLAALEGKWSTGSILKFV